MRVSRTLPITATFTAGLGALSIASAASATPASGRATASSSATGLARAPASAGQSELVVGFDTKGVLRAKLCQTPGCGPDTGAQIAVPDALLLQRSSAQLQVVPLGERRHAIHVSIPAERSGQAWQAVILAKPGQPQPEVIFQGLTGYTEGEEGLRHGPTVEISDVIDNAGTRRILVGEQREELTLCGRPAVLSPKMLTAKDLALRPAKVQRLGVEERERATKLIAEPVADAPPETAPATPNQNQTAAAPPLHAEADDAGHHAGKLGGQAALLRAIGASSGIGWPASLTDGDTETTWAENCGGSGRGEFVLFRAPSDVPLQSFDFVIRPAKREVKNGIGPESLWLVTDKQVFSITFPSDPWKAPGLRWKAMLPSPIRTNCVAIVTETAYGNRPDAEVTFAEVNAKSEFTTASIDNLVGALAGGGPRADAAGTVLAGLGHEAFSAVAAAFEQLDEGGRRVALDVLDHAPCAESSAIYVTALLDGAEGHRLHAIDRLHRCAAGSVPAIEQALAGQPVGKLRALAELLAEVAPDKAIRLLVPRMVGPIKTRRMLREVVGKAARSPKAQAAISELLQQTDLPTVAAVDLLRALGRQLVDHSAAAAASIERLLVPTASFRTKYLLLAPAHLVCDTHPDLKAQLASMLRSDPSAPLRAEAARTAVHLELFSSELYHALEDSDVRVRQSAAQSLAGYKKPKTSLALTKRLEGDEWPMVRVAAAESLAPQPADPQIDSSLIKALDDDSWLVKAAAADAVGVRRASVAGEPLLDLFTDKDERFEVRIAAARALGDICYDRAIDKLTDSAKRLRSPSPDPRDRAIASSALEALAKLHPSDLASRLEPLLAGKDTPVGTKQAAREALAAQPRCGVPAALTTASASAR